MTGLLLGYESASSPNRVAGLPSSRGRDAETPVPEAAMST
jgi:hypothetical protein